MKPSIHHYMKISAIVLTVLSVGCVEKESGLIGYIDGEYTYISSGVPGTLSQFYVTRGQTVKAGELLYQLDPEPEASGVQASQANISNLEAQVEFYKTQLDRQQHLYAQNATSLIDLEKAQTDYDSFLQQLAASKSAHIKQQWALNQKSIVAPVDGVVFDTYYQQGENLPAYRPALSILAPQNIRVQFYLPEKDLSKITIGKQISFDCDGCQGINKATITYISPEAQYTPPLIYSKDSRDKLVYLVRAKLRADLAKNFHPGQPIDVQINHE